MVINTRDFGIVEVDDDAVYEFPEGLYGFEDDKKFAIFQKSFDEVSFLYLQSLQNLDPCFLVFEPWELHPDYQPLLADEDMDACEVKTIDDLIFLVIATVPASIRELSINIKSPVVLNPKTRKAKQVILKNSDYPVRYKPFLSGGKDGD